MSILKTLLERGAITIEDDKYIGVIADDILVSLGTVGSEKELEKYLIDHPNPWDW